jgi:hypothetical protein
MEKFQNEPESSTGHRPLLETGRFAKGSIDGDRPAIHKRAQKLWSYEEEMHHFIDARRQALYFRQLMCWRSIISFETVFFGVTLTTNGGDKLHSFDFRKCFESYDRNTPDHSLLFSIVDEH